MTSFGLPLTNYDNFSASYGQNAITNQPGGQDVQALAAQQQDPMAMLRNMQQSGQVQGQMNQGMLDQQLKNIGGLRWEKRESIGLPCLSSPPPPAGKEYVQMVDWGETPETMDCPHCKTQRITTNVEVKIGHKVKNTVCCMIIFCLPFAWVPCVIRGWRDMIHTCPRCNNVVGRRLNRKNMPIAMRSVSVKL